MNELEQVLKVIQDVPELKIAQRKLENGNPNDKTFTRSVKNIARGTNNHAKIAQIGCSAIAYSAEQKVM